MARQQRDYRAEYRARKVRGESLGFTLKQSTGHAPKPAVKTKKQLESLTAKQQDVREKVLDALALSRRSGVPLDQAARSSGTNMAAVKFYASDAIEKTNGEWKPKRSDRLVRRMRTIGRGIGPTTVEVRSSKQATTLARYSNAVRQYLTGSGDDSLLTPFQGVVIGGVELETDVNVLLALANRGQLVFEAIYAKAA